jgi:hypothetical protein
LDYSSRETLPYYCLDDVERLCLNVQMSGGLIMA